MISANKNRIGTYVALKDFLNAQHFCSSVAELSSYLNMTPSAVRQRIKYLIRRGYERKLRPYADLIGKKGRKNFLSEILECPDWEEPEVTGNPIEDYDDGFSSENQSEETE